MSQLSLPTTIAFLLYIAVVLAIGVYAYSKTKEASDYFLGGRKLSPLVAAVSAGASDMSGWILLGLPGYAYLAGLEAGWITLGLTIGVAANWMLTAKRLRIYTHMLGDAVTVPAYLQRRFNDSKIWLKSISSLSILLFFLFYVASGLIAGGKLFEEVFGLDYYFAVFVGVALILFYTLFGGFLAVSWTDVFQGSLMLIALASVPLLVTMDAGGASSAVVKIESLNPELLNPFTSASGEPLGFMVIIGLMGWGLGYFGQPHVLARFKAIRSANETSVAAVIGVSWTFFGYLMAITVGFCGLVFFSDPLADPEKVFITLTSVIFHPLVAGVLLAAILAAIMSTVDSQLLVCSAALAEDLYPMMVKKPLSADERLRIGRVAVVVLASLSALMALDPQSKVQDVVSYAWAGLGASLGPAILISLYWRRMTSQGALAGVLVGAISVITWSQLSGGIFDVYELVPSFVLASIAVVVVSLLSPPVSDDVGIHFDDMCKRLRDRA